MSHHEPLCFTSHQNTPFSDPSTIPGKQQVVFCKRVVTLFPRLVTYVTVSRMRNTETEEAQLVFAERDFPLKDGKRFY